MKKITLQKKLMQDGKKDDDVIEWAFFAYGLLNCTGKCSVKKLPHQVKLSIFVGKKDNFYCVDGALWGG